MDTRSFLEIFDYNPGDSKARKVGNHWFKLKKHVVLKNKRIQQALRLIFSESQGPDLSQQKVVLCQDVSSCKNKAIDCSELPHCQFYAFGACSPLTNEVNDGESLTLLSISMLAGFSKARTAFAIKAAQKKLIEEILKDPELRDFVESFAKD